MSWQPKNIIETLINKGLPFAIYTSPGTNKPILIVQKSPKINKISIEDLDNNKGFVIAPFECAKTNEVIMLKNDFVVKDQNGISELEAYLSTLPERKSSNNISNHQLSKDEYIEKAQYFINKIKSGEFKKIVLSRVLVMELANAINYSKFFDELCEKYQNTFVYFLYTSETGIWAGATPETLLKKENNMVETMAVAGTRWLSDYESEPEWDEKEKEEQHLVSIYIKNLLSELGVKEYEIIGPETIVAGKIVHLKTSFSIKLEFMKDRLGIFIKGLHPTPAVCGLPKADAYHLIEKAETHNRRLYTGFIGPWNIENKSHLFVNLRCAEFTDNKIMAYVGGGLTKDSIPEDEWQETKNKARTLLSVVEKL